MGLVHLGFITVYLSRPLVSGFTTGAAFIVFTSQVKYFFGMKPPSYAGALALPKVSFVVLCIPNMLGIMTILYWGRLYEGWIACYPPDSDFFNRSGITLLF
jgi:MFS superfamily sulfate permease-like transporter